MTSSLKIFSNMLFSGAAAPPDTAFKRTAKLETQNKPHGECVTIQKRNLSSINVISISKSLLVVIGVGDSRGAGAGLLLDTTGGNDLSAGVDGWEGEGSSKDCSASKQTKKQARHFLGSYL